METKSFTVTERSRVRRQPARASYEASVAYAILDEALVACVGFAIEGRPFVIPMAFARDGDRLIIHAAASSRFSDALSSGTPLCVTVTLLDGVVLARSAMHHSLNYRSVVVFGSALELTREEEKQHALAALVDHVLPGRSHACRPPNALELKATRVLALPLEEVSVKRRAGGPKDDALDLELPYWAGVLPLEQRGLTPVPDGAQAPLAPVPVGALDYRRGPLATGS